ncbi:Disease resistance protein RPM1 [Triticum urartu]|uniref:Disease resistance protein RPM1 n=2 Tax=Triticum urartu TaxID=4572 RepID=M7ZB34_TRIUA|nr:Disease resistance protein RPM1 [Triticum urartu]
MAEIVLLLVIEKIGVALANGAAHQASAHFSRYAARLIELQGSMGRVVRELRIIHDVLCQMGIRNRHNQVYEGWLDEVRKVAHAMEDMVDEYMYQVGREHDTGCCFYLKKGLRKPRSLLSLNQISSKVKEIEKDLAHLSEMKNRWVPMINNADTSSLNYMIKKSQDLANTSRSLDNEDLVGVDENRGKLEQWLGSDDVECSLITLTGMAMDITSLQETLKRYLGEMKYLIILDDVWTPDAFEDLSRSLVCNGKGSRLIITTRQGDVAALASQGHVLTLEPLPEDKAWDLFCKKSFPKETSHHCPSELRLLSEEILSKCKGLPLAIVSIGSLLHVREKTVEEWKRINDQLSWEILNNSRLDHIRNVLHLSFIYLPTYLKSCFLYCSLFPEDYLFHRRKLVRLWMAEGFIVEKGASTLEEVAESYVKELRDGRRLVVHKLKKDIQQPFSIIHVLRTFITLEKSMSSFPLLPLLSEKSRYMTVLELSGLPIEKIPDAIGDLFNLRYLGLRYSKVKLLPKSIEKLSNLLTLDLCGSDIHELPPGIGKLNKLRHLFAEKNIISGRIQNIRYARGVCFPIGLGNLTNLQTVQALEVQEVDGSIRQLRELRQLRSLRIWVVKGTFCEHLCESLVLMQFLSNLNVSASDENEVLLLNALPPSLQKLSLGGRLPEGALLAESPLFQAMEQNLCSLRLSWSQLREDPLPSLSRLPNLMDLCLDKAYNGEKLEFLTGWFPKLKSLYLWDMPDLKMLEIHQGAVTALETLVLGNLESMVEVPPGLEFLMPLQLLSFREITRDFVTLLRQSPQLVGLQWQHTLRDNDQ